jgi:hypothetical protein
MATPVYTGFISRIQCNVRLAHSVELALDFHKIRHCRQIGACPVGSGENVPRPPRQMFLPDAMLDGAGKQVGEPEPLGVLRNFGCRLAGIPDEAPERV